MRKPNWILTADAFEKLLGSFGSDRDRAGERYEIVRRKLVKFFEWRGCPFPEDDADETLNRVARRIDEGEQIHDLGSYVAGVARRVALEIFKTRDRDQHSLRERLISPTAVRVAQADRRHDCLERGLESLSAENRELILQYYQAEKRAKIDHRKVLAERLGIPLNSLRIRVCRIRATLEQRVTDCMERSSTGGPPWAGGDHMLGKGGA